MKQFTKNNQPFSCIACGKNVSPHPTSSRDHCNHCLTGLHVDIKPGDRANTCKGILTPIGIEIKNQKERIVYRCQTCNEIVKCVIAPDDDREEIRNLYGKIW